LRLGKTVNQATAAVGVSTHAFDKWRGRVPGFAAEVSRIRARLAAGTYPTHPFDAEFRARYFGLPTASESPIFPPEPKPHTQQTGPSSKKRLWLIVGVVIIGLGFISNLTSIRHSLSLSASLAD
jgi:hypothetical protein